MLHVAFIVSLKQEQYYEKLVISWDEDQMETGIKWKNLIPRIFQGRVLLSFPPNFSPDAP